MHILRIVDAGIRHRKADCVGRLLDLNAAAELFRHELAGLGDADTQPLAGDAAGQSFGDRPTREDREMRTEHAFGAARHDEGDFPLHVVLGEADIGRKRTAQRRNGIFAREIIDAAVALGLSQDRQDRSGLDFTRFDQLEQTRYVTRSFGRDSNDIYQGPAHDHSVVPLSSDEQVRVLGRFINRWPRVS